ncbi:MAG TPA: DUF3088 family protein [Kofleriaceae bacterium]|nr:DUF3088 family protein [Kofleriaceae bacterium]
MTDALFLLRPGFDDGGTAYFCPYCAQVVGFLTYFPQVRDTLPITELEFPRPRKPVVALVGEANQSLPLLVLGGEPAAVPGVTVGEANGRHFVKDALAIIRYLAATRGVPMPH